MSYSIESRSRYSTHGLPPCVLSQMVPSGAYSLATRSLVSSLRSVSSIHSRKMKGGLVHTNLRDEKAFPSFSQCPHENDIPYAYYRERGDGAYAPIRHWCFLGEISDRLVFNRLCLWVKDRKGEALTPANFHLESRTFGRTFTPGMSNFPVHRNVPEPLTNKGNTIAILYAQQHNFMDGSVGFRIEDADLVQVRPILLDTNSLLKVGPT